MEYWSGGMLVLNPNTPSFQHSSTSIYFGGGVL